MMYRIQGTQHQVDVKRLFGIKQIKNNAIYNYNKRKIKSAEQTFINEIDKQNQFQRLNEISNECIN